jgi:hypothetical protein
MDTGLQWQPVSVVDGIFPLEKSAAFARPAQRMVA